MGRADGGGLLPCREAGSRLPACRTDEDRETDGDRVLFTVSPVQGIQKLEHYKTLGL